MAAWPVRRGDCFSAARMINDDGDEIGHAGRVRLHQGFMAELGSASCAPSGPPGYGLRDRRLAFHFVNPRSAMP
jgi:hypothetical protein